MQLSCPLIQEKLSPLSQQHLHFLPTNTCFLQLFEKALKSNNLAIMNVLWHHRYTKTRRIGIFCEGAWGRETKILFCSLCQVPHLYAWVLGSISMVVLFHVKLFQRICFKFRSPHAFHLIQYLSRVLYTPVTLLVNCYQFHSTEISWFCLSSTILKSFVCLMPV